MKDLIRISIVIAAISFMAACASKSTQTCTHHDGKTVAPAHRH